MKIEVVPYNPLWAAQFESERLAIASSLGDILERAHHIGSTAVEGLSAKPIIDIILEVRSLESLDQASSKLELLGYEAKGEFGIPGRRYFRKGGFYRTHHIHAFKSGDLHVLRHLAFRDYLKAHPDVMHQYGNLKARLAADCNNDVDKYCDGKDAFVKHHEAIAIEWKKEPNVIATLRQGRPNKTLEVTRLYSGVEKFSHTKAIFVADALEPRPSA